MSNREQRLRFIRDVRQAPQLSHYVVSVDCGCRVVSALDQWSAVTGSSPVSMSSMSYFCRRTLDEINTHVLSRGFSGVNEWIFLIHSPSYRYSAPKSLTLSLPLINVRVGSMLLSSVIIAEVSSTSWQVNE